MIQTAPEVRHEGFQQRNQSKGRPAGLLPSIGSPIDIDLPPGKLLRSYEAKSPGTMTYLTFNSNLCNVGVVHLRMIHSSHVTKFPTAFFSFSG